MLRYDKNNFILIKQSYLIIHLLVYTYLINNPISYTFMVIEYMNANPIQNFLKNWGTKNVSKTVSNSYKILFFALILRNVIIYLFSNLDYKTKETFVLQ